MTAPALVKQAAIDRAVRVAKKLGPIKNIRILPDGTIDIVLLGEQLSGADTISVQPEPEPTDSIAGPTAPNTEITEF